MEAITSKSQLQELARKLRVRPDWHEPNEQAVTATTGGHSFDNAFLDPAPRLVGTEGEEMHVILRQDGREVAYVNLAMLFAWATGFED